MKVKFLILAASLLVASPASAQIQTRPQCEPQAKTMNGAQLLMYKRLRDMAKKEGEQFCQKVEAEMPPLEMLDPKQLKFLITPEMREFLRALGVDVDKIDVTRLLKYLGIDASQFDLKALKNTCRTSKADVERFIAGEIKRLQTEEALCGDSI
jgi:hypothetical protein